MKVGGYEKLLYALYVLTFDSSGVSISGKVQGEMYSHHAADG